MVAGKREDRGKRGDSNKEFVNQSIRGKKSFFIWSFPSRLVHRGNKGIQDTNTPTYLIKLSSCLA